MVAKKASFRWLNHGLEHLYQGCIQDFSVIPWRCATDESGNIRWLSQEQVFNEISANIAVANTYGLPINPKEYLSGEHSGLFLTPQQPIDNPNFVAAVSQAGLTTIGADASREPAPRPVGTAMTAPRHPTILYYNAATVAQEVDEFNWLYTTRANGGSGYCEDNPAVATCVAPLDQAGFMSTIIPNDAAFNLGFILSNDPRPFYAHTSNMGGDRIIYPLVESILNMYRAAFAPSAPLQNLTLTEVSATFAQQSAWTASGMTDAPRATASITSGTITIQNSGTSPVPLTAPTGTTVSGATLEAYGGELSGWVPAAPSTTGVVPGAPVLTLGAQSFAVGRPGSMTISAAGQPAPNISVTGALPPGLTFTPGTGSASITGTPTTAGDYPISVTAVNGAGRDTVAVTLRVGTLPTFTSAASASVLAGTALNFTVTASGSPTPTLTVAGALPSGVTFRANANGTATLSGTPTVAGTTSLTFTATNSAGSATQAFTLTVNASSPPKFTSPATLDGDRRHAVFLQGHHVRHPRAHHHQDRITTVGCDVHGELRWDRDHRRHAGRGMERQLLPDDHRTKFARIGAAVVRVDRRAGTGDHQCEHQDVHRRYGIVVHDPSDGHAGADRECLRKPSRRDHLHDQRQRHGDPGGYCRSGHGRHVSLDDPSNEQPGHRDPGLHVDGAPGADLHQPVVVHGWALGEPQLRHHDQWVPGGEAVEDRCVAERADLHCGNRRNGTHQRPHHRRGNVRAERDGHECGWNRYSIRDRSDHLIRRQPIRQAARGSAASVSLDSFRIPS